MAVSASPAKKDSELRVVSTVDPESKPLLSQRQPGPVNALLLDAAGETLVVAQNGGATVIEVDGGGRIADLETEGARALALAGTADLSRVAIADHRGTLRLFEGWTTPRTTPSTGKAILAVAVSPAGHLVATAGADHVVRVHRWSDGAEILAQATKGYARIAFSADARRFAVGDLNRVVIYETRDEVSAPAPTRLTEHDTKGRAVGAIAFSPDASNLVVARSNAGPDAIWRIDLATKAIHDLELQHIALDLAYSPDGTRLLAGDNSGGLNLFFGGAGPATRVVASSGSTHTVRFVGEGAHALTTSFSGGVSLIAAASRERSELLATSGAATNLRVCRTTLEVVTVPIGSDGSVFAPEDRCRPE